ncbi:MAG TPA: hypothetical protein VMU82_20050, partial [Acetobacteraceae bacterium]|nr:hypothetical protein [Acetobacteraceae bacterium]
MSDSHARLIFGTTEPAPGPRRLAAGAVSALLEDGNLRVIRFGDTEVIRGIAFLVRGPTWGTLAPVLEDVQIEETEGAFAVRYTGRIAAGGQRLRYAARIEGEAAGRLVFHCEATAETAFETCRTGFVVLHPIAGVAGNRVRIEHADGAIEDGTFPALIDPVQPMLNLRALTHEPIPGLRVTCRMDGDTFEMEDQRNWSDASFKTYSRPLALPWPFTLAAGETLRQSVTLSFSGTPPRRADGDGAIAVRIGAERGAMPPLALGCTAEEAAAAQAHVAALREAGVAALVCRYDPRLGHGMAELARFRDLAAGLAATVELQIVVPSVDAFAEDLRAAADAVRATGLAPAAVMVVPAADLISTPPGSVWPPCPPLDALHRTARAAFPGVLLG